MQRYLFSGKRLFFLTLVLLLILFGVVSAQTINNVRADRATALLAGQTKLTANDGAASDFFGLAVAIDGETAVIGAYNGDGNIADSGAVYVYTVSNGIWSQQQKLIANDGAFEDYFGWSVAIAGDTIIVGSLLDDDNGADSGSVYVFTRSGTTWSQQQKLTANDGAMNDQFGAAVAISGETAVIGAYIDEVNGEDGQGSAYVFTRSGVVWSEQQKLTANDGAAYDQFGSAVAISGETAVIGVPYDDDGGSSSGSAYLFTRSGTAWSQQQKVTADDAAAFNLFGWSVAIDGETAVIGTYIGGAARPISVNSSNSDKGGAYIFTRSGVAWSQQQKLISNESAAVDFFGASVDIDDNMVAVGAWGDDDNGSKSGAAYLFIRTGARWNRHDKITDDDSGVEDRFGISVALSEEILINGASRDDDKGSSSGSAVITAVTYTTYLPFVINP